MITSRRLPRLGAALLATGALAVALTACGRSGGETDTGSGGTGAPSTTTTSTPVTTPKPPSDQTAPKSTFGLAYHEGKLWVADFYGSQVLGVDPATGTILKRYKGEDGVPEGIDDLTVGPDGSLYWTGFNDGQVGRLTPANVNTVVAGLQPGAGPLAFSRDGKLYVGRAIIGEGIWELDPNAEKETREVTAKAGNVNGFAVGPDGNIYGPRFGLGTAGTLVKIDTTTGKVTEVASGFDAPIAVKLTPAGDKAYVLSQVPGGVPKVSTVDLPGGTVKDLAEVRTTLVDNLTLAPDGRVFVSSFNEPVITVINPDGTTSTLTIGQR
jgi:streptogramin lyase